MLFSTIFAGRQKREQIFGVIIDISMFKAGFKIAKEKLNLFSKRGDVLSNQGQEIATHGVYFLLVYILI